MTDTRANPCCSIDWHRQLSIPLPMCETARDVLYAGRLTLKSESVRQATERPPLKRGYRVLSRVERRSRQLHDHTQSATEEERLSRSVHWPNQFATKRPELLASPAKVQLPHYHSSQTRRESDIIRTKMSVIRSKQGNKRPKESLMTSHQPHFITV